MSIIYTETLSDAESRTDIDIGDGRLMTINITGEGIIMDVYRVAEDLALANGQPGLAVCDDSLGTVGMMFDDWAKWIIDDDETTEAKEPEA